jgi:hypothetical protein
LKNAFGIFEKLGIDMDASSVGDADDLADQMDKLDHLTKMNDEELGKKNYKLIVHIISYATKESKAYRS